MCGVHAGRDPRAGRKVGQLSRDRPTASATSAREATPSLANTLVRWPSTVFCERKSWSAISRFVAPPATRSAISRSRPLSAAEPLAAAEAPLARADAQAEAAELARGLVAVAVRLAHRELPLGEREQLDRPILVAALGQRDPGEHPAARRRHGRGDRLGPLGGLQRERDGAGRIAAVEGDQRAGVEHPRLGQRQAEPGHRRLGALRPVGRRDRIAAGELGAREHAVEPAAPPGLDLRERGQPGRPQLLDAALGLPELEPDHPHVRVRRVGEHALVERGQRGDGLLGCRTRAVDVAELRRRPRLGDEREADRLRVRRQPAGLDRRLGGRERLAEAAEALERLREPDHHLHDELTLPGGSGERDAAPEVARRIGVALAEVLGEPQVVGRGRGGRRAARRAGRRARRRLSRGPRRRAPAGRARTRRSRAAPRRPRRGRRRRCAPPWRPTTASPRSRCRRARRRPARPAARPPRSAARRARGAGVRGQRRGARARSRTPRTPRRGAPAARSPPRGSSRARPGARRAPPPGGRSRPARRRGRRACPAAVPGPRPAAAAGPLPASARRRPARAPTPTGLPPPGPRRPPRRPPARSARRDAPARPARPAAARARRRPARALRAARPRSPPRRRRAARSGGGTRSAAAPPSGAARRARRARRAR